MRLRNIIAALLLAATLTSASYGGIMDNPAPAPAPQPEPTPTVQSVNPADPSDTPTTPDDSATPDLIATIVNSLIPLMF